jgi:SAM-dependent methyltransferase
MSLRRSRQIAKRILADRPWLLRRLPEGIRSRVPYPAVGRVDWGDLRRLTPVDPRFGHGRGTEIDRYYIDQFLDAHRDDIRGRVLEIGDPGYTLRFGDARVERADVLHYIEGNPLATIVGDLEDGTGIPTGAFDCVILTQTLQMIADPRAAVRTLHRILAPGGVVLMTGHGTSKIARHIDRDDWGEYWRFTRLSARLLFADVFGTDNVSATSYGNVLSCTAFLHGLASEELDRAELDHGDRDYEVLVAVHARKASTEEGSDGRHR